MKNIILIVFIVFIGCSKQQIQPEITYRVIAQGFNQYPIIQPTEVIVKFDTITQGHKFISWQTSYEYGINYYEVYKRVQGGPWEPVDRMMPLSGKYPRTYTYFDN